MGVGKKMMVVWICAMVVSSRLMETGANAENLDYGQLKEGICKSHADQGRQPV